MMTARYELYQLEQILSLLHDRRECITLRSIMLELTVTRGTARSIMEEVARRCDEEEGESSEKMYQVVRMVTRRGCGDARIRVELVANGSGEGSAFSVAPVVPPDAPEERDDDGIGKDRDPAKIVNNGEKASWSPILEQLVAGHERALATQRERLEGGQEGELLDIFRDMSILPAPELCEEDEEGRMVIKRVERSRDPVRLPCVSSSKKVNDKKSKFGNAAATPSVLTSKTGPTARGKAKKGISTTAAAFFGSHTQKAAPKKNNNKAAKKVDDKKTENKDKVEGLSEKENKLNKKANKKETAESPSEKENKLNYKPKEKVSAKNTELKRKPVEKVSMGNADDFMGDVDEDDDFLEEERARKARVAKEARKEVRNQMLDENARKRNKGGVKGRSMASPKKRPSREGERESQEEKGADRGGSDLDEIEYDDAVEVDDAKKKKKAKVTKGAMDVFTKKAETGIGSSSAPNKGGTKKRRKRLVEQTTVDANGYMCTETITIWEDVLEDDAASAVVNQKASSKPAVAAARGGAKGSSTTKIKVKGGGGGKKTQKGLMGFFSKK